MENGTRISFPFIVSLFLNICCITKILRIAGYGTASTDSAAFILGGAYYLGEPKATSTIARFQNDKWEKIGELREAKYGSSAILFDGEYLILGGGYPFKNQRLVN